MLLWRGGIRRGTGKRELTVVARSCQDRNWKQVRSIQGAEKSCNFIYFWAISSQQHWAERERIMAMLTRGISFRRQGSSGMSWADNWTFTDAGMFRIPKASDVEPEKAAALVPASQKVPDTTTNIVVETSGVVTSTEPIQVQKTTSSKLHRRNSMWGIRWIKNPFKKSRG